MRLPSSGQPAASLCSTPTFGTPITPMFCRPFIKPQFDYPRALGYDRAPEFSEFLRQLIGYNARIPSTLGEWYKPPQERMYRNDQG